MIEKIKFVAKSVLAAVAINIVFTIPAQAFWNVGAGFNFTGNAKDDVQAFSAFSKKAFSQRSDIYDSVSVLATAPDSLKELEFDWKTGNGHGLSGRLPFDNNWQLINHWSTYRYPRHKDFPIVLTPEVTPSVAKFTKIAQGHEPWFPSDVLVDLLGKLSGKGIEVGGSLAMADNGEEQPVQQNGLTYDLSDLGVYANTEAATGISGDTKKLFRVYATVKTDESGEYVYQYWARNFTGRSVTGSWTVYAGGPDKIKNQYDFEVGANDKLLLKETTSDVKPTELDGSVQVRLNNHLFTFFAPAFSRSGEVVDKNAVADGIADKATVDDTLDSPDKVQTDSNTTDNEYTDGDDPTVEQEPYMEDQ